jgi:O-antigen ligase/tetratricopeptide (TPR) repeat protein
MGKKKSSLKNKTTNEAGVGVTLKPAASSYPFLSLPILFIVLLLITEWIPDRGAGDPMFPQWLYIGFLSLLSTLYLVLTKDQKIKAALNWFARSSFNIAYLALLVLAALSITWAWNKAEGLSTLTYYIVSAITYFNLGIMLYGRKDLFLPVAYLICFSLFFQSLYATSMFLNMIGTERIDRIVMLTNLNSGNKNILAASIMIKLPFLFYLIWRKGMLAKIFSAALFSVSAFAVIMLTSRESLLNLIVQSLLFLVFMVWAASRDKRKKQIPVLLALILLPLTVAYFTSAAAIKEAKKFSDDKELTADMLSRLASIELSREGSSFRIDQWGNALKFIGDKPLTGAGLGNWRIHASLNEQYSTNFISSKHVHNDFLQIGAETGVAGLLLYLLLFSILIFYAIKVFFRQPDHQTRDIAYFLGAAVVAYVIDATFSFPHERPVIQIFFVIIAAFLVSLHASAFPYKKIFPASGSRIIYPAFLVLLGISLWSMNMQFKSANAQMVYLTDFVLEKPLARWSPENDPFSAYPDLAMTSVPLDLIKSRYMIEAGKFAEADLLIQSAIKANPNTPLLHFIQALMFARSSKADSTIHYSLKAIEYRPKIANNYQMLYEGWMMTNDTASINQSYRKARSIHYNETLEALYLKRIRKLPEMATLLSEINRAAGKAFPQSLMVILEVATYEFESKNYEAAFNYCQSLTKGFPKDLNVWQNMGLIRFQQARYEEAIPYLDKAIEYKKLANGLPELLKARCLINIGRKPEGCAWLQRSSALGNKEAASLIPGYCLE